MAIALDNKEKISIVEDPSNSLGYVVDANDEWKERELELMPTPGKFISYFYEGEYGSASREVERIKNLGTDYFFGDEQEVVETGISHRIKSRDGKVAKQYLYSSAALYGNSSQFLTNQMFRGLVLSNSKRMLRKYIKNDSYSVAFVDTGALEDIPATNLYVSSVAIPKKFYRHFAGKYAGLIESYNTKTLFDSLDKHYEQRTFTNELRFCTDQTGTLHTYRTHGSYLQETISSQNRNAIGTLSFGRKELLFDTDYFDETNYTAKSFANSYAANDSIEFIYDPAVPFDIFYTGTIQFSDSKHHMGLALVMAKDSQVTQANIKITITPHSRKENTTVKTITYEYTSSTIRNSVIGSLPFKYVFFDIDFNTLLAATSSQDSAITLTGSTIKIEAKSNSGTGNYLLNDTTAQFQHLRSYAPITVDPQTYTFKLPTTIPLADATSHSYESYIGFKHEFGFIVSKDLAVYHYRWNALTHVFDKITVSTVVTQNQRIIPKSIKEWYNGSKYLLSFISQNNSGSEGSLYYWVCDADVWTSYPLGLISSLKDTVICPSNDGKHYWIYASRKDGTREVYKYLTEDTGVSLLTGHDISTYPAGLTTPSRCTMQNFIDSDMFEDAYGNLWFGFVTNQYGYPGILQADVNLVICNTQGTGIHHQYQYNGVTYTPFIQYGNFTDRSFKFRKTNRTEVVAEVLGGSLCIKGTVVGGIGQNVAGDLRAFTTGAFQATNYWYSPANAAQDTGNDEAISPTMTAIENTLGITEVEIYEPILTYVQSIHYAKRFLHTHDDANARVTMYDPLNSVYLSNSPFTSIRKVTHTLLVTQAAKNLGPNYSLGTSASQYSESAEKSFTASGVESDMESVKTLVSGLYTELSKISAVSKLLSQQTLGGL